MLDVQLKCFKKNKKIYKYNTIKSGPLNLQLTKSYKTKANH